MDDLCYGNSLGSRLVPFIYSLLISKLAVRTMAKVKLQRGHHDPCIFVALIWMQIEQYLYSFNHMHHFLYFEYKTTEECSAKGLCDEPFLSWFMLYSAKLLIRCAVSFSILHEWL